MKNQCHPAMVLDFFYAAKPPSAPFRESATKTLAHPLKKPAHARFSGRSSSRGFTLLEVCISMGILTFAVVNLFALMVYGMGQVSSNIDRNQAVYISQQVVGEARQTPFSSLVSTSQSGAYQRYFSSLGDSLNAGDPQIVYTAYVSLTQAPLPGGDTSQPTLMTVTIKVRKTPGGHDLAQNHSIATFVNMISCSDLDLSGQAN
jgi:uncharacterized protein (TIGR02598 family)